MTHLKSGDPAPDFVLHLDDGSIVKKADLIGRPVVLFFYPEDDSGGCTDENQEFSALSDAFSARDTFLVGVSPDTQESHVKFRAKYGLKVPLAFDPRQIGD